MTVNVQEFLTRIVDTDPVASPEAPVSPRTFFYVKTEEEEVFRIWRSSSDGTKVWPLTIPKEDIRLVVNETIRSLKFLPDVAVPNQPIVNETFVLQVQGVSVGDGVIISPNQLTHPDTRIRAFVSVSGFIQIEVKHDATNSLETNLNWTCTVIKSN